MRKVEANVECIEFFRKKILFLFIPLFFIAIINEDYITKNPFRELEDYGEFLFFSVFYLAMTFGISAIIISVIWILKKKTDKNDN